MNQGLRDRDVETVETKQKRERGETENKIIERRRGSK